MLIFRNIGQLSKCGAIKIRCVLKSVIRKSKLENNVLKFLLQ